MNVNATKMADNVFESAIQFKAEATNKPGVIYDLELAYAGHVRDPEHARGRRWSRSC